MSRFCYNTLTDRLYYTADCKIQEEKKIIEAQQDQIEFLQDKIEALEGGEGEGPTVERGMSVDAAASSTETDAGENGSREAPTIPPAPPPPPIDGVPMAPAFGVYYRNRD